ncbi:MAG TPA: O-antigen ligase family protein [Solirubrobacteraceae bacterium]|nr:O-antigen ligase family protein [Solirubrobacteraceae bacterium]
MSSVVTESDAVGPEPAPADGPKPTSRPSVRRDLLAAALLAAALAAIGFATKAGSTDVNLGALTWTEVALLVAGLGMGAAAALLGVRGRAFGAPALLLFGVLAALTYASIGWSIRPDSSWLEGNQTVSYAAVFGGGIVAARLLPGRWRVVIGGVTIASLAICAWALLTKVFPGSLDASDTLGRLNAPFGYWNAVGLAGALGLPGCLWLSGRPASSRLVRTLASPAIAVLVLALVMSFGRGALAAAVIGLAIWFAAVPFRLRAGLVLVTGAVGAGAMLVWSLGSHSLTHDKVALAQRTSVGHTFGLVLLLGLAAVTAAGYGAAIAAERVTPPTPTRRQARAAVLGIVVVAVALGIAALAASSRGLTGEISHVWDQLTNPVAHVGSTPGRLVALGSSRPVYWREGLLVGEHHLLAGAGAGSFETASLRYANSKWAVAAHAHSYVIQTFADLGLVGVAVMLALLVTWALAAARPLGIRVPRAGPEHAVEATGMFTLLSVVVIFGLHSAIDWTWYVPGVALPALICAGWLAGRGPLDQPVGRLTRPRAASAAPGAYAAVTAIVALAFAGVWFTLQPLRAADADAAAVTASVNGNTRTAFADARAAAAADSRSIDPLTELSSFYLQIRNRSLARVELVRAVALQPENPDAWVQLGEYDLLTLHRPAVALGELRHARLLDPSAPSTANDIAAADAEIVAAQRRSSRR